MTKYKKIDFQNQYCCVKTKYVVPGSQNLTKQDLLFESKLGTSDQPEIFLWPIKNEVGQYHMEVGHFVPVNYYNINPSYTHGHLLKFDSGSKILWDGEPNFGICIDNKILSFKRKNIFGRI